ncbi:MAG: hypothetical protein ACI4VI_00575 [Acutalibacteraceae bacterium]
MKLTELSEEQTEALENKLSAYDEKYITAVFLRPELYILHIFRSIISQCYVIIYIDKYKFG